MDAGQVLDLARQAILLTLLVGCPILAAGLVAALIVGVLQAATQVQDQTLSFVPKIAAMLVAAVLTGPWMLQRLVEFARQMFGSMP